MRTLFLSLTAWLIICTIAAPSLAAPMVITYRSAESASDSRYDYDFDVLKLALEKTRPKWGDFELVPSPKMSFSRAEAFLMTDHFINPMFKISASNQLCEGMVHVPFPVDLGIVGYRLFFMSAKVEEAFNKVRTIDDLKHFSIGQGIGWLDVDILTSQGFTVVSIPHYDSLFRMVAERRFDLLSRGVNEVLEEYRARADIPNLVLSQNIGIHYPLPRFFFTNQKGEKAAQRVHEGLVAAYEDGSLIKLWEHHYRESIQVATEKRTLFFEVQNPLIDRIDPSYKIYMRDLSSDREQTDN